MPKIKKVKNILITCAAGSGPIYQSKKLSKKYNVFLADANNQNIAPYLGHPFAMIPFGNNPKYKNAIKKLVKKWGINCILPGADEELLPTKKITEENTSILSVLPSAEFIQLCLNKKNLMKKLEDLKISQIKTFYNNKNLQFPLIVKPIFGRGSRGVHIIKNNQELDGYKKLYQTKDSKILVQDYIEGTEYTISVIVNNLNRIIGIVPKKIISKKGITKSAVTEKNKIIDKICERIVDELKPNGPFNVQLKIHNNKPYIFEINPRLSTTSVLTDKAFGNEVDLYIKYYNKEKIANPPKLKNNIFLYRYEENVFK